jgi:hypothetical protein
LAHKNNLCEKIGPNLPDFENFRKITRFLQQVPAGSQNIKIFFKKRLSYLVYSQVCLNLLVDDSSCG